MSASSWIWIFYDWIGLSVGSIWPIQPCTAPCSWCYKKTLFCFPLLCNYIMYHNNGNKPLLVFKGIDNCPFSLRQSPQNTSAIHGLFMKLLIFCVVEYKLDWLHRWFPLMFIPAHYLFLQLKALPNSCAASASSYCSTLQQLHLESTSWFSFNPYCSPFRKD